MITTAEGSVMQSEIVSSSSSLNCNTDTSEPDYSTCPEYESEKSTHTNTKIDTVANISPKDQHRLVRCLRDVEVSLPTIHQEDLLACMRSPAFRLLQQANII